MESCVAVRLKKNRKIMGEIASFSQLQTKDIPNFRYKIYFSATLPTREFYGPLVLCISLYAAT